ncbi:MAG: right-handed parallel beta-helix repeat-containing protein [Gammaproteobacteria bacterium]
MNVHPVCVRLARTLLVAALVLHTPGAAAVTYAVGPGAALGELDEVPWESLAAGDRVEIAWRAAPYRSKWVIARQGTAAAPIVVAGLPGPTGQLPVVDGNGATTRRALDFWNEDRGVIKIGGASVPSGPGAHVVIESLEIRGGHAAYGFSDDRGNPRSYRANAAAVFVEQGSAVVIRNCVLTDSGNGLFVARASADITIEHSHLHGNGNVGSIFEHNAYTEAHGMRYQFNRFGPLRPGALGNNLKDRSAGLIVRYNWIEDGNRQLDLVDSSHFAAAAPADYATTIVYGNVLVEHDGQGNRQMVHYGGDSGNTAVYRKGRLYFFHNTLVSERSGRSTLFRLATNDERADIRNNVFFAAGGPGQLELATSGGTYEFADNWITAGWVTSFDGGFVGSVSLSGTIAGSDPGFADRAAQNYRPAADAPLLDAAGPLAAAVLPDHAVTDEYVVHRGSTARGDDGARDLGAFEATAASATAAARAVPAATAPALPLLAAVLAACGLRRTRRF